MTVSVLDPGMAFTDMTRDMRKTLPFQLRIFWPILGLLFRSSSPEKAARASIHAASDPEAGRLNGQYFERNARPGKPSKYALDPQLQAQAWRIAEELQNRLGVSS